MLYLGEPQSDCGYHLARLWVLVDSINLLALIGAKFKFSKLVDLDSKCDERDSCDTPL